MILISNLKILNMKKTVVSILCMFSMSLIAQDELLLYPSGVAESNQLEAAEQHQRSDFVINIARPRMYYYPATVNPTGTAVVICPGGGYSGIAVEKEGIEIAKWFNSKGVSAFVLYYRMPNRHFEIPVKDALTAIELVRKQSKKMGLHKNRIGIMGFSAGGHLASTAGTQFTSAVNRPDFMILGYPVISMKMGITHTGSRRQLIGNTPDTTLVQRFSNEDRVTHRTPPAFLFHARDDKAVPVENSRLFVEALQRNKVEGELQEFERGGHGFGMRPTNPETDRWPVLLEQWMKELKLMK
jgi:acetyl esterase/lipase